MPHHLGGIQLSTHHHSFHSRHRKYYGALDNRPEAPTTARSLPTRQGGTNENTRRGCSHRPHPVDAASSAAAQGAYFVFADAGAFVLTNVTFAGAAFVEVGDFRLRVFISPFVKSVAAPMTPYVTVAGSGIWGA